MESPALATAEPGSDDSNISEDQVRLNYVRMQDTFRSIQGALRTPRQIIKSGDEDVQAYYVRQNVDILRTVRREQARLAAMGKRINKSPYPPQQASDPPRSNQPATGAVADSHPDGAEFPDLEAGESAESRSSFPTGDDRAIAGAGGSAAAAAAVPSPANPDVTSQGEGIAESSA